MNDLPGDLRCGSCCFWRELQHTTADTKPGEPGRGRCRVNPPRMGAAGIGVWPVTRADDWCGEWSDQWDPDEPEIELGQEIPQ